MIGPALGSRDVAAAEMAANEKALYEAAKQEGELTWYTAHSDDITAQALGRGFEANYYGIRVNVVRTTAQAADGSARARHGRCRDGPGCA